MTDEDHWPCLCFLLQAPVHAIRTFLFKLLLPFPPCTIEHNRPRTLNVYGTGRRTGTQYAALYIRLLILGLQSIGEGAK